MFDKWRRQSVIPGQSDALAKHSALLSLYLAGALPLLRQTRIGSPGVQTACQLFVLGMADMIRHVNKLNASQFLALLQTVLADHQLAPQLSTERFVDLAGKAARKFSGVDQIIREGANSIRGYVANRDMDAPADLLRVAVYAEKNANQLEAAMSDIG
jgi:hypothetical protein